MGKQSYGAWLLMIYLQLPECSGDPSSYFLVKPYLYSGFAPTLMAEWQLLCGYDLELLSIPEHSPPVSPEADEWGRGAEASAFSCCFLLPAPPFPALSGQRKWQIPTERLPPKRSRLQGHSPLSV